MKSTLNPFLVNTGFLFNQPIGYSRTIPFEVDEIDLGEGLVISQLSGSIELVRNQDGFRSASDFKGLIGNECGRCLEPFQGHIHSQFEEFFTFPFITPSDDEMQVPENGNVDFLPILHDYILMEMPINPVCKPDCKGLCDICGVNRNLKDCRHTHRSEDEEKAFQLDLESLKKALDT